MRDGEWDWVWSDSLTTTRSSLSRAPLPVSVTARVVSTATTTRLPNDGLRTSSTIPRSISSSSSSFRSLRTQLRRPHPTCYRPNPTYVLLNLSHAALSLHSRFYSTPPPSPPPPLNVQALGMRSLASSLRTGLKEDESRVKAFDSVFTVKMLKLLEQPKRIRVPLVGKEEKKEYGRQLTWTRPSSTVALEAVSTSENALPKEQERLRPEKWLWRLPSTSILHSYLRLSSSLSPTSSSYFTPTSSPPPTPTSPWLVPNTLENPPKSRLQSLQLVAFRVLLNSVAFDWDVWRVILSSSDKRSVAWTEFEKREVWKGLKEGDEGRRYWRRGAVMESGEKEADGPLNSIPFKTIEHFLNDLHLQKWSLIISPLELITYIEDLVILYSPSRHLPPILLGTFLRLVSSQEQFASIDFNRLLLLQSRLFYLLSTSAHPTTARLFDPLKFRLEGLPLCRASLESYSYIIRALANQIDSTTYITPGLLRFIIKFPTADGVMWEKRPMQYDFVLGLRERVLRHLLELVLGQSCTVTPSGRWSLGPPNIARTTWGFSLSASDCHTLLAFAVKVFKHEEDVAIEEMTRRFLRRMQEWSVSTTAVTRNILLPILARSDFPPQTALDIVRALDPSQENSQTLPHLINYIVLHSPTHNYTLFKELTFAILFELDIKEGTRVEENVLVSKRVLETRSPALYEALMLGAEKGGLTGLGERVFRNARWLAELSRREGGGWVVPPSCFLSMLRIFAREATISPANPKTLAQGYGRRALRSHLLDTDKDYLSDSKLPEITREMMASICFKYEVMGSSMQEELKVLEAVLRTREGEEAWKAIFAQQLEEDERDGRRFWARKMRRGQERTRRGELHGGERDQEVVEKILPLP